MSQAQIKNAVITTGVVLLTIFIARKVPGVAPLVNRAING